MLQMKLGRRLGKFAMARNNQSNQRSAFAESAYAHAERRRRRRHDTDDYNLHYYEDEAGISRSSQAPSDVVHAEFQPLAGASVVIITNTSKKDKVTDARTLKLMEERESLGCAVDTMGGRWVPILEETDRTITHAIWIASEEDNKSNADIFHLSNETLVKLNTCLTLDIPVVSPSWLMKVSEISPGQHWSEVDIEGYVPRIIQNFGDMNAGKNHPSPPRHSQKSNAAMSSRRDTAVSLGASIGQTYKELIEENPDMMEDEAIKRALELSMLDFAIVHQNTTKFGQNNKRKVQQKESPHEILQIEEDASPGEIKNAYRKRALQTHPDKGGKSGEFEAVARAYRLLLNAANNTGLDGSFDREEGEINLKTTAHWDSELKEHRNLVRELYQDSGQNIDDHLQRQNFSLERLGLCHKDAGSKTYNEKDQLIRNSCFYLSLASSYLSGIGALAVWDKHTGEDIDEKDKELLQEADDALIRETALQLKRAIEAAVLTAHPEWAAKGIVGEEVQAFSDFLVYILDSQTICSDWSVVVFDTCSGFVDIFKGKNYKDEEEGTADTTYMASNTLTLRYVPGHYQPLVAATCDSTRPTLKQIISVLDESGVLYVVTDGTAE